MRRPAKSAKLSAVVVALRYILKTTRQDTYSRPMFQFVRTRQDTCSRSLPQFDEDSTRYLEYHSVTIWWGLDKIPAVALCYNLIRTRQDTWSITLLQFDEDSTRYLEYHSVTIWWGLDKIPAVALCYDLMRTRQDTWSITLLQFDEDSTRYLEYHSVTIWWGLDKIPGEHSITIWWGLDKIPAVALCYNLMSTRQDTGRSLCYNLMRTRQDTCSRNYDWNRILLCFTAIVIRNFGPVTDPPAKHIPRYYIISIQQLVFQVLMEYKNSPKVFMKTTAWSYPMRVQINPWGPIEYYHTIYILRILSFLEFHVF